MTPVIRIDDQVMGELKKRAVGLGLVFEPPNATLRGLLGLDATVRDVTDEIVGNTLKQSAEDKNVIKIRLNRIYAARRWVHIPVSGSKRGFFPGFKEPFELVTDAGVFTTYISSGKRGTPVGHPTEGKRIQGGLSSWYDKHPELKDGTKLRIEALEPGKRYKLSVVSQGV